MKLILANSTVINGNRGCVALALSAMCILKQLLESRNISYTFYLPNSGHSEIGEHVLRSGGLELKYIAIPDMATYGIKNSLKNLLRIKQTLATRKIYKHADAILDIGQGDSFSDIYGKRRFDWIYGQYRLGMKFNIPYCMLPQTIGPFYDPKVQKRAIKSIEYASCVMTRDRQSYDFVKQITPNKDVTECIDVAFFMPFERKTFNKDFIHVGLNISALLWHGGYTKNNQFGLTLDYQKLIREIISYFLSMGNVKLHLIPHVVGAERHIENDYAVSYDLFEEYNNDNLILSPLFLDPIAAKGYIAGMDFFMGARMHATIAAFSSGVPVVPMAYSRKFNGLFVDTLDYKALIDMKAITNEDALQTIKVYFRQRNEEKIYVENKMNTIVQERKKILVENLDNFLGLLTSNSNGQLKTK